MKQRCYAVLICILIHTFQAFLQTGKPVFLCKKQAVPKAGEAGGAVLLPLPP